MPRPGQAHAHCARDGRAPPHNSSHVGPRRSPGQAHAHARNRAPSRCKPWRLVPPRQSLRRPSAPSATSPHLPCTCTPTPMPPLALHAHATAGRVRFEYFDGIKMSCVFGLRDKKHKGTTYFLSATAIFYKTQNPNQANGVRSRGKRQLRFEIAGVK
jgi:hypothetical protein